MSPETNYSRAFYKNIKDGSLLSAREVLPTLLELVQPKSIADIGCGTGAWLAVARDLGVKEVFGIDGDYVDVDTLLIPPECFSPRDLKLPLKIDRRFDLVISLEVAEHLPAENAGTYIDNLVSLSDVIAFSAAIPNQGGTGHVNEQWPEYWQALFKARGFIMIDCLRPRFWNNRNIERWYRQNLILVVREKALSTMPTLMKEYNEHRSSALSIVHPAMFLAPSLTQMLKMIPQTILRSLRKCLGGKREVVP